MKVRSFGLGGTRYTLRWFEKKYVHIQVNHGDEASGLYYSFGKEEDAKKFFQFWPFEIIDGRGYILAVGTYDDTMDKE